MDNREGGGGEHGRGTWRREVREEADQNRGERGERRRRCGQERGEDGRGGQKIEVEEEMRQGDTIGEASGERERSTECIYRRRGEERTRGGEKIDCVLPSPPLPSSTIRATDTGRTV